MKKIFLAGDYYSGTGPANVTKYYIENMPEGTLYQKQKSKLARIPEIVINTIKADVVVYSGYSKQNILGLKLAKLLKKPSAYIMHGCVEHENKINLEPSKEMANVERKTMELASIIYAVSSPFADWLKDNYKEYADKTDYITNGLDENMIKSEYASEEIIRDEHMIFSVGGGMPRKKIRYICEAVKVLRESFDEEMYLTVVGAKGADSDLINSYPFVKNLGRVSFDKTIQLYKAAAVFVQNSCFETFGLAPIEAIGCNCSTLCSNNIGALSILSGLESIDVIDNYEDPMEIAYKIRQLISKPNATRLRDGIDWNMYSWKRRSQILVEKLEKLSI